MFLFLLTSFCVFGVVTAYLFRVWHGANSFALVFAVTVSAVMYSFVGTPEENAMDLKFSAKNSVLAEALIGNKLNPGQKSDLDGLNALTESLKKKLDANGDDINGWVLLARSYMQLRNFKKASEAYESALKILPGQTDLMIDFADSLAMIDGGDLSGRPMELISQVLKKEPTHQKALALAATNAMNNKQIKTAVRYWERLKDTLPGDSEDSSRISNLIIALQGGSGSLPETELSKSSVERELSGKLIIDSELFSYVKKSLTTDSAIFLIVKEKNGIPMPIAVRKISYSDFNTSFVENKSLTFEVSDRHSLRSGKKLSDFFEVLVSARLSLSGEPKPDVNDLKTNVSLVKNGDDSIKLRFLKNDDN